MKKLFVKLPIPIIREFPFCTAFMIMMGILDVLKRLYEKTFPYDAVMQSDMSSIPYYEYFGELALLFLWSYILSLLLSLCHCRWLKIALYCIIVLLFTVKRFIKSNFAIGISPQIITLIAETNSSEAIEFFHTFGLSDASCKTYIFTLFYIGFIIIFEKVYVRFKEELIRRRLLMSSLSIITLPLLAIGLISCSTYYTMFNSKHSDQIGYGVVKPRDPLSDILISLKTFQLTTQETKKVFLVTQSIDGRQLSHTEDSLTVVLVIGESYIKSHAHIYGYSLSTTPFLDGEKEKGNLFVFDDVISPYNGTSRVLKNLFCCNSLSDGEKWYDYPFFPAIFKKAGYQVFFWDNQNSTNDHSFSFSLQNFLFGEGMKSYYTQVSDSCYKYDEELVTSYRKKANTEETNKLVIFHLMGQHTHAKERYPNLPPPQGFRHYTADSIKRKDRFLDKDALQYIAEYDNATLYNDHVLQKIIELFSDKNAVVVYLSDHGETAFDYTDRCGRYFDMSDFRSIKYQLEVPFMIWCSNTYIQRHPAIIKAISSSTNKPFMTDNLCHIMFHLGGINSPHYIKERDLISNDYIKPERIVMDNLKFDELKLQQRSSK